MARRRDPSFFKILLGDHFCHKLKIPGAFLKHFDGNVPEQFRLCTPAGTWFVDVEKLNHKYYFQNGWNKFVHENGLKVKVILVFRYTGNSELSVDIYGKNACKKLYGMATRKESDCLRLKDVDYPMEEGDEDDNPSIEILDDDPSVEILDDVPQCRASIGHYSQLPSPLPHIDVLIDNEDNSYDERESYTNAEEDDEDNYESEEEDEDENLSAEESETAADVDYGDEKSEGDNEDEDEDHNDDDDVSIEILSEKLSCSKTRGKSPLGSHLRKSKITCSNSEVRSNDKDVGGSFRTVSILKQREQLDMEVRKLSALQRARYFESKSAKPCVVLPMRASYAQGYYLSFPRDFAKRHFKKKPNHAIFRANGVSHNVEFHYPNNQTYETRVGTGWSAFARINNLKESDVCVFVLTDNVKFEFGVEIFHTTDAAICTSPSPGKRHAATVELKSKNNKRKLDRRSN